MRVIRAHPQDGAKRLDPQKDERVPCSCCGELTHIHLLDAKPNDPKNPDSCDWEVYECRLCYGSKWSPTGAWASILPPPTGWRAWVVDFFAWQRRRKFRKQ